MLQPWFMPQLALKVLSASSSLRALPATSPKGEMKTSLNVYPEYGELKRLLTAPRMP